MIDDILNTCWDNWKTDRHPKDRRMYKIHEVIGEPSMSTENIRFLINEIVRRHHPNFYVEVGTWVGHSLMSAAYQNEDTACVGIEDFSRHPDRDRLNKTFTDMHPTNAWVCEGSFEDVIPQLTEMKKKVGVYYYDGDHSHCKTLLGLYMGLPLLTDHAYILMDDLVMEQVAHAKRRFLDANPEWKEVMCIVPPREECVKNNFRPWFNGFCVLERK